LKRVQEEAQEEENKELGKNNMERFFFFGGKFCFHFVTIVVDFRMDVIGDASLQFGWMTNESTSQRCSFGCDPLCSWIIRRWETARVAEAWWRLLAMKSIGPVAMPAGMLASKPANRITVNQIKSKKGTAEEAGARAMDGSRLSWRRSTGPEACYGCHGSM
jgi:hypothetical protein